jgi:plasmid stabilization system protein ParE
MGELILNWTKPAQVHLKHLYEHIAKDSPLNALRVVEDIVIAVEKAKNNPAIYASDKFKINNDGSYRAFEKHRYRVSFRYTNNMIRVLRVRHTSRIPKRY